MRKPIQYRRIVALAATYVVVLQALLLPLAVAAAAPMPEGLCIASSADAPAPASHNTGCGCAAGCGTQCCAQGLLGRAPGSLALAPTDCHVVTPALALEPVAQATPRGPQIPRAPPAA